MHTDHLMATPHIYCLQMVLTTADVTYNNAPDVLFANIDKL